MGGAARFVIREGECPFCRLVREESTRPDRLVWEDHDSVAFAPYASRSPFEVWIVPRRHEADFGRATDADVAATAEALRQVLAKLATSLDGPPYNLVLHTAPLREQVDADLPLALGDPPASARDRRARARDGAAGQPRLARGCRRRAPGRQRRSAWTARVELDRPGTDRASHGGEVRRLWADERAPSSDRAP